MREARPGELVYFQHVMQKLDEVEHFLRDSFPLRGCSSGGELISNVVRAAPGRGNDVVIIMEELDEQLLGRFRLFIASTVRHWLTATGLVIWIFEIDLELLKQLNSRYSHFRVEHIYVTGDHQPNSHTSPYKCNIRDLYRCCSSAFQALKAMRVFPLANQTRPSSFDFKNGI